MKRFITAGICTLALGTTAALAQPVENMRSVQERLYAAGAGAGSTSPDSALPPGAAAWPNDRPAWEAQYDSHSSAGNSAKWGVGAG
jgi:hypothetical protein